ncbi:unnamed protein product, partial [Rotaria sp. Silwood2]
MTNRFRTTTIILLCTIATYATSDNYTPLTTFPVVKSNWFNCSVLSNGVGGGGIPISSLKQEAVLVVSTLKGLASIYATDKRGVGNSSLLECPTSIVLNFLACLPFIQQHQYRGV